MHQARLLKLSPSTIHNLLSPSSFLGIVAVPSVPPQFRVSGARPWALHGAVHMGSVNGMTCVIRED